jgi:activator of HSP90 ATPase
MTVKMNPVTLRRLSRCSRREMIAGSIIGALGLESAQAQQASSGSPRAEAIVAAKAIHQEEDFQTSPERIYEVLLDAKQFKAFSGGRPAEIHPEAGGTFMLFAGHIVGRNLELVPRQRIVQAWRVVSWPDGIYSIARFELQVNGSGARVIFDHTGFPAELAEHLESGWRENYWQPLRKYLG